MDGWSGLPCVSVVGLAPSELAVVRLAGGGLPAIKATWLWPCEVRRWSTTRREPSSAGGPIVWYPGTGKGQLRKSSGSPGSRRPGTSALVMLDTATMPSTLWRARSSMRLRSVSALPPSQR